MALPFYNWSKIAANNANADSTVNWAEGQSPSSVNDSARAMMASTAAFRDDIAGAIVTAGTSTAYTVSSYQVFDTLAHLAGQLIAFTPHTTQTGTCTLNVDGLGAKPLRSAPGVEIPSGTLIQGTPYIALFNNTDGAFYLHGLYGNPYNVPIGGGMDYWFSTAPNSSFVFPVGQAVSRTTYATFFANVGTTFGAGDGSTTFNLPDKRGRASAMIDSGAGRLSTVGLNGNSPVLGGAGGTETVTLSTAQIPSHTHANSLSDPGHAHSASGNLQGSNGSTVVTAAYFGKNDTGVNSTQVINVATNTTGITISNAAQGGGGSHPNVQPTICCNYIIRII